MSDVGSRIRSGGESRVTAEKSRDQLGGMEGWREVLSSRRMLNVEL